MAVGVGDPGDRGLAAFGEQTELSVRAAMLDEGLDLLTGLLSGERVDHQGTHYRADGVALRPAPVQAPRVPVWVGGSTQAAAVRRRAARADGIVPYKLTDTDTWSDFTPDEVRELVNALPRPAPTASRSTWRSVAGAADPTNAPNGRTSKTSPRPAPPVAGVRPGRRSGGHARRRRPRAPALTPGQGMSRGQNVTRAVPSRQFNPAPTQQGRRSHPPGRGGTR